MKNTLVMFAFFLSSQISVFGANEMIQNDTFNTNQCVDKLTLFCLYGDVERLFINTISVYEEIANDILPVEINKASFLNTSNYLSDLNFPSTLIYPLFLRYNSDEITKNKRTNPFPNESTLGSTSKMIFGGYFLGVFNNPVDLSSDRYPFHDPRYEGFGLRLRI